MTPPSASSTAMIARLATPINPPPRWLPLCSSPKPVGTCDLKLAETPEANCSMTDSSPKSRPRTCSVIFECEYSCKSGSGRNLQRSSRAFTTALHTAPNSHPATDVSQSRTSSSKGCESRSRSRVHQRQVAHSHATRSPTKAAWSRSSTSALY